MNIKELRLKLGLTQKQFAEELGSATFSVIRWEKGSCHPSPIVRKLIMEIYGVDVK